MAEPARRMKITRKNMPKALPGLSLGSLGFVAFLASLLSLYPSPSESGLFGSVSSVYSSRLVRPSPSKSSSASVASSLSMPALPSSQELGMPSLSESSSSSASSATQVPAMHSKPVSQSALTSHEYPAMHLASQIPPQSSSDSPGSGRPLVQLLSSVHMPFLQFPVSQSVFLLQTLPFSHLPQLLPQSISVSLPFLSSSKQLGCWHLLLSEQYPLLQSLLLSQSFPIPQVGPHSPPQSMPDSELSLMLLLQEDVTSLVITEKSVVTPSLDFSMLQRPRLFFALTLKIYRVLSERLSVSPLLFLSI